MRPIAIFDEAGQVLAARAWTADTWAERGRGWMGKAAVETGEGLLLAPASSIHTFGMRFTLDLAFLDAQGKVVKLVPEMKPGRLAFGPFFTRGLRALELPAGTLAAQGIQVGQTLFIQDRKEGRPNA